MRERSAKVAGNAAMSDAITIARMRVEALAMPAGWHDTKESRRARVARMIGTTARRVRAILSGERIRLTADEYVAIERAWEAATAALATDAGLARNAAALASAAALQSERDRLRARAEALGEQLAAADAVVRLRGQEPMKR